MRQSLRTELWKAVHNTMFLSALLFGVLIASMNILENVKLVQELSPSVTNVREGAQRSGYLGFSLFVNWIAVNTASSGNAAFSFVWPILAAMPYGWSYYRDRRTGVYNQLVSRCGVRTYFFSKYLAVFISGGLAVAIPILFNLLVNALICPYCVPKVITSLVMIFDGHFLSEVFYTNPWLHALIWCGVVFLYGGAAACLTFLVGTKPQLQVMVTLTPFACLVLVDSVISLLREFWVSNIEYSPLKLVTAASPNQNPEWVVGLVFGIMLLGSLLLGYWQVRKHELA